MKLYGVPDCLNPLNECVPLPFPIGQMRGIASCRTRFFIGEPAQIGCLHNLSFPGIIVVDLQYFVSLTQQCQALFDPPCPSDTHPKDGVRPARKQEATQTDRLSKEVAEQTVVMHNLGLVVRPTKQVLKLERITFQIKELPRFAAEFVSFDSVLETP